MLTEDVRVRCGHRELEAEAQRRQQEVEAARAAVRAELSAEMAAQARVRMGAVCYAASRALLRCVVWELLGDA